MEGSSLLKTEKNVHRPELKGVKGGEWWNLLKDSALAWNENGAASMGAAIAYYTIFSIAPLLVITMAIAGFFFGAQAAQGQIFGQAQSLLGVEGAAALQGMVQSASKPVQGIFATIVSVLLMFMGASGVFAELQGAMDRIWRAPVEEKQSGIWYLLRRRIFTFGLLLAIAFLLLVSLAVSAFISTIQSLWSPGNASLEVIWQAINFMVSFLIVTGLFAIIYKLLPRVSVAWRDVLIGAVITALLFTIGKFLIGLYIGKAGVTSGFGAAGAVIAMVLWVYYSAQIFLLGAEFTWLFAQRFGSFKNSGAKLKNEEEITQMRNDIAKPNLSELLKTLFQNGRGWIEAELKLAKAEAGHRLRTFAIAIGLGFVVFLILIGTLVVLAQSIVALITPFVGGPAVAGLIVGVIMLIIVLILALVAKHLLFKKMPPMTSLSRLSKVNQQASASVKHRAEPVV
jgi:membrane protein